jgi:hypothetical protein
MLVVDVLSAPGNHRGIKSTQPNEKGRQLMGWMAP